MTGYSKLTTHLGEVYGEAGGAKVRELLNPPFERIIECVHRRNGSVVKFAGDAVIIAWYMYIAYIKFYLKFDLVL